MSDIPTAAYANDPLPANPFAAPKSLPPATKVDAAAQDREYRDAFQKAYALITLNVSFCVGVAAFAVLYTAYHSDTLAAVAGFVVMIATIVFLFSALVLCISSLSLIANAIFLFLFCVPFVPVLAVIAAQLAAREQLQKLGIETSFLGPTFESLRAYRDENEPEKARLKRQGVVSQFTMCVGLIFLVFWIGALFWQ